MRLWNRLFSRKAPKPHRDDALNPSYAGAPDIESFTKSVKSALVALALSDSDDVLLERARRIHRLCDQLLDMIVEAINELPENSDLSRGGTTAMVAVIGASSRVEAFVFSSDRPKAPQQFQEQYSKLIEAAVQDEAAALARGLATLRELHGLDSGVRGLG